MHAVIRSMSRLTSQFPAAFVGATVILTLIFGAYAGQLENSVGQDAFSPDNPELNALERVGELFTVTGDEGATTIATQVVVTGPDVVSAEGMQTALAIRGAAQESVADYLAPDTPAEPAILDWLAPAFQAAQASQTDVTTLDSAAVDALYLGGIEGLPGEFADQVGALLGDTGDRDAARSPQGLMIINLDVGAIETDAESGVLLDEDGSELTDQLAQLAAVERRLGDAITSAPLPDGYEAGFIGIEALFSDDSFEAELPRLFGLAFGVILLILGTVYFVKPSPQFPRLAALRRTVADVAVTMFTIVASIMWMNGIIAVVGGVASPVTQIVPILLIGLGVDYAIHLTSRYREELGKGHDVTTAGENAISGVGVALALATVTTVVGFMTNMLNPLPALRDFGWQAAIGIVSAFLLMLTFVPAVRILLDRRAERAGTLAADALGRTEGRALPGLMARTALLAEHAPVQTLLAAGVLGLVGLGGMMRLESGFSFVDFVPETNPAVEAYDYLNEHFAGGFGETTNVLIEGDDVATPEIHNGTLAAMGATANVEDVVVFGGQPAGDSPAARLLRLTAPQQAGGADVPPELLPDPAVLQAMADFGVFAADNGLQPDGTFAADADVAAVYDAAARLDPSLGAVLHTDDDGTYTAALVAITTQAGEKGAGVLQAEVHAAFAPLDDLPVEYIATSQNIMADVILGELSASQISSLITTLIVATLLLMVVFGIRMRRPFLGVITVAPVMLVVLLTFAAMAFTNITFNPMTSMISALAIGIGVPFTIHVTHRFEEDLSLHPDMDTAMRSTMRNTGGALAGSAFTTMAGFATLVTSSLVPFRQLGLVVAYAIGFALISSVLVLPSMLALWHRWHDKRGTALGNGHGHGATPPGIGDAEEVTPARAG